MGTVWAANWAIETYGFVPVGFGYVAPAGVYFAGLAFLLRDGLHEFGGRPVTLLAILVGGALSWAISPAFAVASATAFVVSELADFAVYSPLRERQWWGAVAASNAVGLVVDSLLFLYLAFGSIQFWQGQVIGKAWVTLAFLPLIYVMRRGYLARRTATATPREA